MSCLAFLSENLVDDSTISLITGTENLQFPLTNLKSTFTTKVFRSVGNTVEVQLDLLTTQSVDSFAVTGHRVDGLGFTAITIYGSGSTDFSGSTPIVIDTNDEHNFGFKFFTEASFRYWKIELTGNGSYAELSNIFLGKRVEFTENSLSVGSFNYLNADNSVARNNYYGGRFVDIRTRQKTIRGSLQHLNTTEYDMVNDLFTNHGKRFPLWMIVDPDGVSATNGQFMFSSYGYFRSVSPIKASAYKLYNATINIEQAG